jgi:glutamate-5-semialdehyde dehydrogenase
MTDQTTQADVLTVARQAREAAAVLAPATRQVKDAALLAMADALEAATDRVVAVNEADVERAREAGTSSGLVGRRACRPSRTGCGRWRRCPTPWARW